MDWKIVMQVVWAVLRSDKLRAICVEYIKEEEAKNAKKS